MPAVPSGAGLVLRAPARGYLVAVLALVLATLTRWALDPALGDHLPYVTYFVAVAFVAWVAGLGPAIAAMLLGSYVSEVLFFTPRYAAFPYNASPQGLFGTFTYFMVTGMSIVLTEAMHRARRRAEQDRLALGASESRLRLFIENAPAAIAMFGRDLQPLAASRRFMEDFGPGADAPPAASAAVRVQDLAPAWVEALQRGLAGEVLRADADPLSRDDGSTRYVNWEVRPWHDDAGHADGVLMAAEDVSATIQATRDLRDRARLLDLSNDTIFARDLQDRITFWNQGAVEAYGYPQHEALGRVTHDLLQTEFPAPLEAISAALHREGRWAGELVHTARSGRRIVVASRWALVRDAAGRPVSILETNLDVTERRRSEQEAQAARRYAEAIVGDSPFGLYVVDADFRIAQMNMDAQRSAFAHVRPLIGRPLDEAMRILWPDAVAAEIVTAFRVTLETGEPFYSSSFVQLRLDTSRVEGYEWELHRITAPDGGFAVVCYYFDSTRLRDTERRLTDALAEADRTSRVKDEFLATLSHELRTPMHVILGWVQVLRHGADRVPQGLEVIERNARLQSQIIEDLLDMSRILTGKVRLDVQRVDMAKVVEDAVEAVRPAADAKGVRLQSICDPRAGTVHGDASRLQQVSYNLLSNAVKFTPRGGNVQVHYRRVNSHVELGVSDTGVGIAPAFLPRVFERFSQQDASAGRAFTGIGLGLAIARHIVELHGGRIHAASDGVGKGATFTVHLPVPIALPAPATPDAAPVLEHPAVPRAAAGPADNDALAGLKLLVVDDDADARALLRAMLEQHAAEVVVAESGEKALDRMAGDRPHVLVCDIGMPLMDGYAVIDAVRRLPPDNGGRVPAIALTAFARSEDRVRAMQAGFDLHLSKPIDAVELVTAIRTAARTRTTGT